jgi:hypothetical protein
MNNLLLRFLKIKKTGAIQLAVLCAEEWEAFFEWDET